MCNKKTCCGVENEAQAEKERDVCTRNLGIMLNVSKSSINTKIVLKISGNFILTNVDKS